MCKKRLVDVMFPQKEKKPKRLRCRLWELVSMGE